jgi:methyltransferase family protein
MYSPHLKHTPIEFDEAWLKEIWDSAKSTIAKRLRKEKRALHDPQTFALDACAPGRYVLKLGGGCRNVARELKQKLCQVTEVALTPAPAPALPANVSWFDEILLLEVLERLPAPATFMLELRRRMPRRGSEVVITTPNAVSFATRLMLALARIGQERSGVCRKRKQAVFTFKTLRTLLHQSGYELVEARGVPVPFQSAVGDGRWIRILLKLNRLLLKLSRHLFADQICVRARPLAALREPRIEHTEAPAGYPQMLGRVA